MERDFVESLGLPFFAHRLRRLSELFVEDSGIWLRELGVQTPPRAVSTVLLLSCDGALSVTEIADRLHFSHPLIIQLLRILQKEDLVRLRQDPQDGRRRMALLTEKGAREAAKLRRANAAMARAYRQLFAETGVDALACVERLEHACRRTSLLDRLHARAESAKVRKG